MVPTVSFIAMGVSALLSVGVPVALYFVVRKSYGKGILPVILGAAGYLLFARVLEQVLHLFVLRPDLDNRTVALMQRPFLYMLYGGLAAGVFEETARLVSFLILKKRCGGFGTALRYGIGHGGMEAAIIGGAAMIRDMALGALLNTLGAEGLAQMSGAFILSNAQDIAATPAATLFLGGAERMLALVIQISLSVIMYYAVYQPRKLWLYPAAIVLHALVDCPAALFQAGVITNVWAVEGIVAAAMVVIAAFAVLLHRRMEANEKRGPLSD
ncbi:MAG: YhfC family intramembrane metalloprotease [Firmicutes bacterium]|nr:YhfC family intramembrane metalloprotease [Bacillota bacterium]